MMEQKQQPLLGGRLQMIQPKTGYRSAIDPILLSASCKISPGARVLDVGTGCGTAAMCLAQRCKGAHYVGLEIQPFFAALAARNATLNNLQNCVHIIRGNLAHPPFPGQCFEVILTNPPYYREEEYYSTPNPAKKGAHCETMLLTVWINQCLKLLKPGGYFHIIHRAARLAEILAAMSPYMGDITVFPLWPRQGEPAKRLLVWGKKQAKGPIHLLPGLILHQDDNSYTPQAAAILQGKEWLN